MGVKQVAKAVASAPKHVAVGYWRGITYPFKGARFVYFKHFELFRFWVWPIALTLFLFLFFSTAALAGHVQIAERGAQRTYLTGLIRERAHPGRERSLRDAKLSFALVPGTRRFSSANLELVLDDGRALRLELEPQGNAIAMPGPYCSAPMAFS